LVLAFVKASQIETVIVFNHSCMQFWHAAHNLAFLFSSGSPHISVWFATAMFSERSLLTEELVNRILRLALSFVSRCFSLAGKQTSTGQKLRNRILIFFHFS